MAMLNDLAAIIAAQPTQDDAIEAFIAAVAERIKATSNDQNVQRLAKALVLESGPLAAAIKAKRAI
jgi:hypothetical protein